MACLMACAAIAGAFLLAAPAAASEEGESPVNSTAGWVLRWINFAILAGGGTYLLGKKAPALFRARGEAVGAAIRDAGKTKEEADRRLREAEGKLAGLEREVAGLRAAAQQEAVAEAERIQAAAREEALKVERAAKLEQAAAERAARLELKTMGARLAVEQAENILRKEMSAETQGRLVKKLVAGLVERAV